MTLPNTFVGHVFDPDDPETLPSHVRRMNAEDRAAWCAAETERYRIVKRCPVCPRDLIEGEQIPHGLSHAPNGRIRAAAGTILGLPPEDAREALALAQSLIGEVK